MAPRNEPPPGATSINQILSESRSHLQRLTPSLLHQEINSADPVWGPTHLIDIRPAAQRSKEGALTLDSVQIPDSHSGPRHTVHVIERNVLEWRMDPQSEARNQDILDSFGYDTRVVVVCSEGYTSSLAARELQRLGLRNATDLDGGYWAWKGFTDEQDNGRGQNP